MTANQAAPDHASSPEPDQATSYHRAPYEQAAERASYQPDGYQPDEYPPAAGGPPGPGAAPGRGSRGRHAGPASVGPPSPAAQRAALASRARRILAACRAYPLATAGGTLDR